MRVTHYNKPHWLSSLFVFRRLTSLMGLKLCENVHFWGVILEVSSCLSGQLLSGEGPNNPKFVYARLDQTLEVLFYKNV